MSNKLTVSLSPHIHSRMSTSRMMWNVVLALIPALCVAVYTFGWGALRVTLIALAACLATEWVCSRFMKGHPFTLKNGSAVITALLLAFNLPSILPWWMVIIGSIVAIGIGKMSFGGLGRNIWNPALVGRVFLLLSFPAAMTTWPVVEGSDAFTGATMLNYINSGAVSSISDVNFLNMSIGDMNGSLGETGAIAILLGLGWLLLRGIVTWHIPISVIGSAAVMSWALGGNPLLDIFAGGLLLGACFMATDYVTSPMTHSGQIVYGIMIGIITMIIRRFGAYPEGMSFAILLMNSFTPLINRYCRPTLFGSLGKNIFRKTERNNAL